MAGIRYRRRSNWIGWLVFFALGGAVFVGLLIALQFLKFEQARRDQRADEEVSKQQAKQLEPDKHIRNYIKEEYKKLGKGYEIVGLNPPKKVQSKLGPREFVIARVQHKATSGDEGSDQPVMDQVFVIEYMGNTIKIKVIKFEDWDMQKTQFGIEDEP